MKKDKGVSIKEVHHDGEIIVEGGVVTRVCHWEVVHECPYPKIIIQRELDERFSLFVSDRPEGSQTTTGFLHEVLRDANSEDAKRQYVEAFSLTNPTDPALKKIFPRHKVVFK